MTPTAANEPVEAEQTLASPTKTFQTARSGSSSPLPPDDAPPFELSALGSDVAVDGEDEEGRPSIEAVVRSSDEKATGDVPRSPPLDQAAPLSPLDKPQEGKAELDSADIPPWHPLEHDRNDSKDLDQTQDTTFVDESLATADEKHSSQPAPRSQTSNLSLRVDPKPLSPQPWELVQPPSNNNDNTDYYSTVGTKNFGVLQKSRCVLCL